MAFESDSFVMSDCPSGLREAVAGDSIWVLFKSGIDQLYEARSLNVCLLKILAR